MIIKDILARIRQRLDLLSMSMEAASVDAGLSKAYLKQFMSARQQDITVGKLDALAPVLKTTTTWLLSGEGDAAVQPDKDTADVIGIVPYLKKDNLAKAKDYLTLLRDSQKSDKAKG